MATTHAIFDVRLENIVAELRTRILASSDWADVTPVKTNLTTLSAASSVGTSSLTIASTPTTQPGLSIGDFIVIDEGLATEERNEISARNAVTSISLVNSTRYAHAIGATVRKADMLLRNVAPNGAELVVDLGVSVASTVRASIQTYRSFDTGTGIASDPLGRRHISWRSTGGAITDTLHCEISAGPGHLYISIEGPRAGETNASDANGSPRTPFAISEIVPYFPTGDVPVVCVVGSISTAVTTPTYHVSISRNRADTLSWVAARLGSIQPVVNGGSAGSSGMSMGLKRRAAGDGKDYLWPYIVSELTDGLRGRLKHFHYAGPGWANTTTEEVTSAGERYTYNAVNYVTTFPYRAAGTNVEGAFGSGNNASLIVNGPVIAIPAV